MEEIAAGYAADGLPGNDLFWDSCHFKLSGNRMLGFEVAKAFARDRSLPPSYVENIRTMDVQVWTPRQLGALYFLKVVKWHRWKFLMALKRIKDDNSADVIRNYEVAVEEHKSVDWAMKLQLKAAYSDFRAKRSPKR